MPLSDHEQRLLEQMEQQLLSDDPRFASTMRGPRTVPAARRRLVVGILGVVVGIALLVLSAVVVQGFQLWLGGAAAVVMLAGAVYAMSASSVRGAPTGGPAGVVGPDGRTVRRAAPPRPGTRPAPTGSAGRGATPAPGSHRRARGRRGTFMQRLEQRWDRRRDDRWS